MEQPTRICVVDLGTNSFHAVIVDLFPGRPPVVVDKLKEPVLLGQAGLTSGLTTDAVQRAEEALRRIDTLARRRNVTDLIAYATSAIREADNGPAFITHIRKQLGIDIQPIAGEHEARLICRGVQSVFDLSSPTLLVDIGGGSTELLVATREAPSLAVSLKLGAARLTARFVSSDPISDEDRTRLNDYLDSALGDVFQHCREQQVTELIGSSGTLEALVGLAMNSGNHRGDVTQHVFGADKIRAVNERLMASTRSERLEEGLDERRADQIVAGAVLLNAILRGAGIQQVRISPAALREGMVEEYIEKNAELLRTAQSHADPLARRAWALGLRYRFDKHHAREVSRLSGKLFDQLSGVHDLGPQDRRLLQAAALVHDVGHAIAGRRHHKHTRYIIEHSRWPGVDPEDVAMLAIIVRYHRRALPKRKHRRYKKLSKQKKARVRQLAAMLRLADKLDRSRIGNVEALQTTVTKRTVRVTISTRGDPGLELIAARSAEPAFKQAFRRRLELHAAWRADDQPPPDVSAE